MSKIVGIFSEGKWEFYDFKLNKVENFSKGDELYLILPDNLFFFFQTDIVSKRRVAQTVKAYAKTLFPSAINVGYVNIFNPVVGYIFSKDKLKVIDDEMLNAAVFVTTPFLVYAFYKDNFAYIGNGVCAACIERKLKFYIVGDESTLFERLSADLEIVKFDKSKVIKKLVELIKKKSHKKIALSITEEAGFENWKIWRFIAVFIITFFFVAGMIIRYTAYSRALSIAKNRLDKLYAMALGGKHYSDPYGVLLYKADYGQKGGSITPTKLLYFLSKAKNGYNLDVEFISFSNGSVKVKGVIDNYNELLSYIRKLKKMAGKEFVVRNTSSTKDGRLKFVLVGNLYG